MSQGSNKREVERVGVEGGAQRAREREREKAVGGRLREKGWHSGIK